MCPRKRRWADKDMTHVRLGYECFQMFYELNTTALVKQETKTLLEVVYYEGFTKFGRSCIRNEYRNLEKFAEWLIKNGKKLADWSKDKLYDEFYCSMLKKNLDLEH